MLLKFMRAEVRQFVRRFVRGEKVHVLRADGGTTLCRVGVSHTLDVLKVTNAFSARSMSQYQAHILIVPLTMRKS